MKKRTANFFEGLGWLGVILIVIDADLSLTIGTWIAPVWVLWVVKICFISMILEQIIHVSRKDYDK